MTDLRRYTWEKDAGEEQVSKDTGEMTSPVGACDEKIDVSDNKDFFNKIEHVVNKCKYFCKHLAVYNIFFLKRFYPFI